MELSLAILTLLLSFFFSGTEIAFLSASRLRIELRSRRGDRSAEILSNFKAKTSAVLITILIGNNLALVAFTQLMEQLSAGSLESWFGLTAEETYVTYTLVQTTFTTLIVLVMAEYIPKAIFRSNADILVYPTAYVLNFFYWLLYIPVNLVNIVSKFLLKFFFRVSSEDGMVPLNKRDLENYLEEILDESSHETEPDVDTEMLNNALAFRNTKARDCMIPRTEIIAMPHDTSVSELLDKFISSQLSKILIYDDNLDSIRGVIHSISLFGMPENVPGLVQPVLHVPESMPANVLLGELTENKRSVAIVVDEFGGTAGMITIEDLVEEVFGEIEDEHSSEKIEPTEPDMVKLKNDDGSFTLGARLEIDDVNESFELNLPEADYYSTLGGLIIHEAEDIPTEGAVIDLPPYQVTIMQATPTRVIKVHLVELSEDA